MGCVKKQTAEPVTQDERKQTRDYQDLVASLEDADSAVRRWAARDLMACPESAAALVERMKREPEVSVREVMLATLAHLGDATAISGLLDCLRSEYAALYIEAVEAMKQLPEEVSSIMNGLLTDLDPNVRLFAVNILDFLRHPDVEAWLVEVIEHDPHVYVCATALDVLSEVGTEAVLQPIERLKSRYAGDNYIQFAADMALRRIREG